jgi:hypothetical protein
VYTLSPETTEFRGEWYSEELSETGEEGSTDSGMIWLHQENQGSTFVT